MEYFMDDQELIEFFEEYIGDCPANPDSDPDGFHKYFNERLGEWFEKKLQERWEQDIRGKVCGALLVCLNHGDAFFMEIDPMDPYICCPECGGDDTELVLVDSCQEAIAILKKRYVGDRKAFRNVWKGPSEQPPGIYVTGTGKTYFKIHQGRV